MNEIEPAYERLLTAVCDVLEAKDERPLPQPLVDALSTRIHEFQGTCDRALYMFEMAKGRVQTTPISGEGGEGGGKDALSVAATMEEVGQLVTSFAAELDPGDNAAEMEFDKIVSGSS